MFQVRQWEIRTASYIDMQLIKGLLFMFVQVIVMTELNILLNVKKLQTESLRLLAKKSQVIK